MIDVVYPIITKYSGDWFELRHSLRSLECLEWIRDIYIIGALPPWVRGVKHLCIPDNYRQAKDANIINKILAACSIEGISKNILVNSDDQYFLQTISPSEIIPYIEDPSPLPNRPQTVGVNNWFTRVITSLCWLKENGYNDFAIQCHTPYIIDKYKYPQLMAKSPWAHGHGMWTHIYQNMAYDKIDIEPEGRTIRIRHNYNYKAIKNLLAKSVFLNHNDGGLNVNLRKFISEQWPKKSKWEK